MNRRRKLVWLGSAIVLLLLVLVWCGYTRLGSSREKTVARPLRVIKDPTEAQWNASKGSSVLYYNGPEARSHGRLGKQDSTLNLSPQVPGMPTVIQAKTTAPKTKKPREEALQQSGPQRPVVIVDLTNELPKIAEKPDGKK